MRGRTLLLALSLVIGLTVLAGRQLALAESCEIVGGSEYPPAPGALDPSNKSRVFWMMLGTVGVMTTAFCLAGVHILRRGPRP